MVYRLWRSPGGIAVDAEEGGDSSDGYHVQVVGPHDADVTVLIASAKTAVRRRIARMDMERAPGADYPIMADDDLIGRLVWNEDGGPYDVVVDGRRLTWTEFGRALEPFEGWEFRLSFREKDVDDAPELSPRRAPAAVAFRHRPDARTH
ncbi:MAG: hypothetical protein ABI553_03045 [Chloroflexota bacterium]